MILGRFFQVANIILQNLVHVSKRFSEIWTVLPTEYANFLEIGVLVRGRYLGPYIS